MIGTSPHSRLRSAATGIRVHTRAELTAALERAATTRGRFQLIEAMLPRGSTSETLARFVAGFKAARARGG